MSQVVAGWTGIVVAALLSACSSAQSPAQTPLPDVAFADVVPEPKGMPRWPSKPRWLGFVQVKGFEEGLLHRRGWATDCDVDYVAGRRKPFVIAFKGYADKHNVISLSQSVDGMHWDRPVDILKPTPGGLDRDGLETPSIELFPQLGVIALVYEGYPSNRRGIDPPARVERFDSLFLAVAPIKSNWMKPQSWTKRGQIAMPQGSELPYKGKGGLWEPSILSIGDQAWMLTSGALQEVGLAVCFDVAGFGNPDNALRVWTRWPDPIVRRQGWAKAAVGHINWIQHPDGGFLAVIAANGKRKGLAFLRCEHPLGKWQLADGPALPVTDWYAGHLFGPSMVRVGKTRKVRIYAHGGMHGTKGPHRFGVWEVEL